ncbi:MAG: response regulator [Bacteroidota bacterium]
MDKIQKIRFKSFLLYVFFSVMVLIGGYFMTKWRANEADSRIREDILTQTEEIATAIDPHLVRDLTFTASDSATPQFNRIRNQMIAYGKLMKQRGIYSMAMRNGEIVFGPETYSPGDPLASSPGEVYKQPSKEDFEIFRNGKSVVMGPYKDEYGNFISGLAPVPDPLTGKALMVIGVDVVADDWNKEITKARELPIGGTVITLLLMGFGYWLLYRRSTLPEDKQGPYRYIESYMVAAVGLFITAAIIIVSRENNQRDQTALFRLHSSQYYGKLRTEMNKIQRDLSLLKDYFESSQHVERSEFQSFVKPLVSDVNNISYMWAPFILHQDRMGFENAEHKSGFQNFRFQAVQSDGTAITSPVQPFYYPVQYIDPPIQQKFLPGFDLCSDIPYKNSIQMASSLDMPTSAITESLMMNGRKQTVLIAFIPVQSKFSTSQDSGCVAAVIGLESWLDNIFRSNKGKKSVVSIDLIDLMNGSGLNLIASYGEQYRLVHNGLVNIDFYKQFSAYDVTPMFNFGHTFALITYPNKYFQAEHPDGIWWIEGLFLLAMTLLITLFVRFLQNRQLTLKNIVRQKTAALEIAISKAEEGNRLKSALLLNLSHELRTPINGILGFGDILKDQLKETEHKKMASHISNLGQNLLVTFTSMLQLSRLEAEKSHPDFQVCNLGNLAREEIVKFRKHAALKKITIKEDIEANLLFLTDPTMFSDILFFLLDNALKFTEAGYIWVNVHQAKENNTRKITISIRDTGIGIKDEQLNYIFDSFRQGSEGIGRSHSGNGMGLTLCKRFVTLLGGQISVETTVGTGSTFTVTFSVPDETGILAIPESVDDTPAINAEPFADTAIPEGNKLHILVVEDNPANAELVVMYLKMYYHVDVAFSGKLALKYSWQNKYDLVLMDINLGAEMDGIQTTKELRAMENYGDIPVIAVTGYSTDAEKKQILDEGLNDFLSKPFRKEELLAMIDKWIRKNE